MSEPAYSRLLCTPRPALGAALGCCHRSRLALEQLRGQVSGLGSQLRGQLADLSSAAVPKVTGLLQDLPRVFCAPTAKFSEGSFLDRLPAAMVEKVTSTVITKGPHKLAPIITDGPLKPASVAPSERRLSITDGAVIARPETPPATEADDSASSDVDSGTADVMDDLPSPGTPEPEEEEEEEDGVREEDRHRVVISVTQDLAEIHGPLGCQEVPPVVVRLKPGDQGRYGFNVKGGAGSNIPVTVSKVAPRSAICCNGPRLSEGDQVVLINGVDVSSFTLREVVRFIKSCRERQSELELTVKPNLNCELHDDLEEPLVRFVPDTTPLSLSGSDSTAATLTLTADATPLARSIAELAHALSRGMAQLEFDGLARRELSLTMDDCRLPSNIAKNRYRDISPYDCSRVVLTTAESGDYINANYVNMEIPGSGIVNRYIAAQGPLHHTTDDFWAMIWEQKCPLVVMLTTLVEQGRVKCHQYWPDEGQSMLFGDFEVTTASEEVTENFAFREITIISQETGEERHISHMQYVSWPDHGVPEQPADFVQFVQRVRSARAGLVEPTVVHCSAGIGRTGVLILMETAMCLIEANQPVYPLELVRTMRRQRAMMIQTTSQFEFVCEAVVQVHREGTVRPLEELSSRD
ncbi:tyrosine-protein phosphatase non-receptor type 4-like isoform X1 [Amphibalanus amphitrite]|uniref:tyrosine-protein phosphatase non-receptor type 4-like isoform X1 n=1 Tax=Amphibalanus amphitrite TaxID=1232801 RepID=UPI001C8FE5AE|nr:tyrosine-protein phosphatase non-receptor type 4-like isoform X1 [Amphibalanus amphitrite]